MNLPLFALAGILFSADNRAVAVSPYVFEDRNGNLQLDSGEGPVPGELIRMHCSSGWSTSAVSNRYGFANFPLPLSSEIDEVDSNLCCFTNANSLDKKPSPETCMEFDVVFQDYPFAFSDQLPPTFPSSEIPDIPSIACGDQAFSIDVNGFLSRIVKAIGWTNRDISNSQSQSSDDVAAEPHPRSIPMEQSSSGYWLWGATFDNSPCAALYKFNSSTRDVSINGLVVVHQSFYGGPGYRHGNVSGDFVSYGTSGFPIQIESRCSVSTLSVYATLAWKVIENVELTLEASSDSGRRLTVRYPLDWQKPSLIQIELPPGSWNRIRLSGDGYNQVVFDDLQLLLNCGVD